MWSTDLLSVAFLGGFVPSAVLFVILLFTKKYTTVPDIFGTTLGVLAWCSVFNIIPELTTLGAAVGYYSIDLVYCLQDGDLFFACHHFVTLSLIASRPWSPLLTARPLMSYILTIDLVNPLLAHWKRRPSSVPRYVALLVAYILLRICWLHWLLFLSSHVDGFLAGGHLEHLVLWGCRGLYGSMLVWFCQFVRAGPVVPMPKERVA